MNSLKTYNILFVIVAMLLVLNFILTLKVYVQNDAWVTMLTEEYQIEVLN